MSLSAEAVFAASARAGERGNYFSILLETQEMVVYNAPDGEALVLSIACLSSGGLAQLGEHYVRNVGVGGSTPLPSTRLILTGS